MRGSDAWAVSVSLKTLREAKGYTQRELGLLAGTHQTNIAHAEAGVSGLSPTSVMRIVRALELTPDEARLVEELRLPAPLYKTRRNGNGKEVDGDDDHTREAQVRERTARMNDFCDLVGQGASRADACAAIGVSKAENREVGEGPRGLRPGVEGSGGRRRGLRWRRGVGGRDGAQLRGVAPAEHHGSGRACGGSRPAGSDPNSTTASARGGGREHVQDRDEDRQVLLPTGRRRPRPPTYG